MNLRLLIAVLLCLSLQACKDLGDPVSATVTDSTVNKGKLSFSADVQPIFVKNCALTGCHTSFTPAGNFNATTYAGVRAGGFSFGTGVVVPGDSATSAIMDVLRSNNNLIGLRMPLGGQYAATGLPDSLIVRIGAWIVQGALDN